MEENSDIPRHGIYRVEEIPKSSWSCDIRSGKVDLYSFTADNTFYRKLTMLFFVNYFDNGSKGVKEILFRLKR